MGYYYFFNICFLNLKVLFDLNTKYTKCMQKVNTDIQMYWSQ